MFFILPAVLLLCMFIEGEVLAYHSATYGESAHGDTTHGVNRSGTGYDIGACIHCHDTFDDSICGVSELMLFAPNTTGQIDNFCFQCHTAASSVQVVTNNDYGCEFGGGSANFTNIQDAFASGYMGGNPEQGGSSHNLEYIRDFIRSYPANDWLDADDSPCRGCHPLHLSQKNHDPYPGSPPYRTAIRRPDDPSRGYFDNLWGDETGSDAGSEMMSESMPNHYQAPFHAGLGYEPAGDATEDGSNLPNFALFCYKCHNLGLPPGITDANLPERNGYGLWGAHWYNEEHGAGHDLEMWEGSSEETYQHIKSPYKDNEYHYDFNYLLSCTDCHEPHGSPNPFLLRTCVNGKDNITVEVIGDDWGGLKLYDFCTACHVVYTSDNPPPTPYTTVHPFFTTEQAPDYDCMSGYCHGHAGAF